jgi:hypothetical protein
MHKVEVQNDLHGPLRDWRAAVQDDNGRATMSVNKACSRCQGWILETRLSPIPVTFALLNEDSERVCTSLPAMPPLAPPLTRELRKGVES